MLVAGYWMLDEESSPITPGKIIDMFCGHFPQIE
jgi:hypothetical protein